MSGVEKRMCEKLTIKNKQVYTYVEKETHCEDECEEKSLKIDICVY